VLRSQVTGLLFDLEPGGPANPGGVVIETQTDGVVAPVLADEGNRAPRPADGRGAQRADGGGA